MHSPRFSATPQKNKNLAFMLPRVCFVLSDV